MSTGSEVTPNGLRQPPPVESHTEDRDAVGHRTEVKNRRDRAVGCTRCWAAERELLIAPLELVRSQAVVQDADLEILHRKLLSG
jgi:hypothetical protein